MKKIFLAVLLVCSLSILDADDIAKSNCSKILCADIGGTRIKTAVLHPHITLEELKQINVREFSSTKWFNESLLLLFDTSFQGSWKDRVQESFDKISFGISGPIFNGSYYLSVRRRIPFELKTCCEEKARCSVWIENDAVNWGKGFVYWKNLAQQKVSYPCLAITLGTGIGCTLLYSADDLALIEINAINSTFSRLGDISSDQPVKINFGRKSPHSMIGNRFFKWIKEKHPCFDEQAIQRVYNERICAFLKDLVEYLSVELDATVKSIALGGGNSRYVLCDYLENNLQLPTEALNQESLAHFEVSPDIISLLGCLSVIDSVKMIPSPQELWLMIFNELAQESDKQKLPPSAL